MENKTFEEFLKEKESNLIKIIGEKEWLENKVYFTNEIISMVEEWELNNISNKVGKCTHENITQGHSPFVACYCTDCGEEI